MFARSRMRPACGCAGATHGSPVFVVAGASRVPTPRRVHARMVDLSVAPTRSRAQTSSAPTRPGPPCAGPTKTGAHPCAPAGPQGRPTGRPLFVQPGREAWQGAALSRRRPVLQGRTDVRPVAHASRLRIRRCSARVLLGYAWRSYLVVPVLPAAVSPAAAVPESALPAAVSAASDLPASVSPALPFTPPASSFSSSCG